MGAEGSKPQEPSAQAQVDPATLRVYPWQNLNLDPEGTNQALRNRYTSYRLNSDSSALPLTVHCTHKRPAHSHPHQPPYPKPTPPTHAGLSIGYRLRRKELLKENLAQRTDLQQEWLALIGAMDSALKSKLETRSMSNSDIRCASYARAHTAAFLLCTVPPFFFLFSSHFFFFL